MSSPEVCVLRALLAPPGPVCERGRDGRMEYRRPTLTTLNTEPPGLMIAARAAHWLSFAFTEDDGTRVSYEGTISQDDLFRVLYGAGLLTREVRP